MMVDAHIHQWELARNDYGWITPDLQQIYRDFTYADLQAAVEEAPVERFVLVQCAQTEAETEYLLGIAAATPAIAGVVGWTDFEAPDARDRIVQLARRSKLVGFRPMIQDIADPAWMLKSELAPVFESIVDNGMCFDALVLPKHLAPLLELIQRHPDLRVVIDHGAKPFIASGELEPWRSRMLEIGAATGTFCKFSGLVTEAGEEWTVDMLRPYAEILLEAFGEDRLMWGSDWPVVTMAIDYRGWLRCAESLVDDLIPASREKIFRRNAMRFYGIG